MKKKSNRKQYIICQIFICLFILLCVSLYWEKKNFGGVDLNSIVFTMTMPLEGTSGTFVVSYLLKALLPAIVLFVLEILAVWAFGKYLRSKIVEKTRIKDSFFELTTIKTVIFVVVMFVAFLGIANYSLKVFDFIRSQYATSEFIKNNYVDPNKTKLEFPKKKRNLIYIFMESAESTLQDKKSGGLFKENFIPEMTKLEKDNVSFSQNSKYVGANVADSGGYTTGGMVAEQCGLPMKVDIYKNAMDKFEYFLPGATSIGELLEKEGYYNYFMCGSKWVFGGKEKYLSQHGYKNHFDYNTAVKEGKIDEDYFRWWGFEDEKLYQYSREKITEMAKNKKPFNFCMLTVDTHHVGGYKCRLCKNEHKDKYANVWSCASRQVYEFVNWIKKQSFYEETTVVICGDHCSMDPNFYEKYGITKEERKVYNVFINSAVNPIKDKNRKFTCLDIFPSTLAAMGVKIKGNQLALGVNLFSSKNTLPEKYGFKKFDDEMSKKSTFFNDTILYPKKK